MIRRALLLAPLACLALVAPADAAPVAPDLAVAYQTFPGACDGQVAVEWGATSGPDAPGAVARATGVTIFPNGTWTRTRCEITIDPAYWASETDPVTRCRVVVHEVGHLYGHTHAEGGVMAADAEGPFTGCDGFAPRVPIAERVIDALNRATRASVQCDAPARHVVACERPRHGHVLRYRALVHSDRFVLQRRVARSWTRIGLAA